MTDTNQATVAASQKKASMTEPRKTLTKTESGDSRITLTGRRKQKLREKLEAIEREKRMQRPRTTYDAKSRNYKHKDDKDVRSIEPSYTHFTIPFEVQCKLRYVGAKEKMEARFQKELKLLEIFQPTAYEAARYNRHIALTTLWPPLHNHREIDRLGKFFERTPEEKKRLSYLLNNFQY